MNDHINRAGFEDCVLNSYEDYEPYGFVSPQLIPVNSSDWAAERDAIRDRVIEAELLAQCGMVGC